MFTSVVLHRGIICDGLIGKGFTYWEAAAIYHKHVAPMDNHHREVFYSRVQKGNIAKGSSTGRRLLLTARG